MQRCRLELRIKSIISFDVQEGEEETAQDLIEQIEEGCAPTWIEELIRERLFYNDIEIEKKVITGREPEPEEELNFDY